MDDDGHLRLVTPLISLDFLKMKRANINQKYQQSSIKIGAKSKPVIVSSENQFYQSTSPTELNGGSWSNTQPEWAQGKYIWLRTFVTYSDGTTGYSPSETGVCITGNTGAQGSQGLKERRAIPEHKDLKENKEQESMTERHNIIFQVHKPSALKERGQIPCRPGKWESIYG